SGRAHEPAPRRVMVGQEDWAYRFEWGPAGLAALAPGADVVVLVDVLSFTTGVDVAASRGASVRPVALDAVPTGRLVAVPRDEVSAEQPFSLSPVSLTALRPGEEIVLPSPNGATLAAAARDAGAHVVLAGCLRNASAVAQAASRRGSVAVVAAGER